MDYLFIVLGFVVVCVTTQGLIKLAERGIGIDGIGGGPQKFHDKPVPRTAGLGILLGLAVAAIQFPILVAVLVASLPAFIAGLAEDLTRKIAPMPRLIATFVAAILVFYIADVGLTRVDIGPIDTALQWSVLSLLFTVAAIGAIAHSVNIIDGYNGLAGGVVILMNITFAAIAWQVGDSQLAWACAAQAAATLGFLVFNFPRGRIFLGDGGAYLLGFLVGVNAILLVERNADVSAWTVVLIFIYPIFETIFSIYRKRIKRNRPASQPDGLHFHMMIFKRLVRLDRNAFEMAQRNAATSPYLWIFSGLFMLPAIVFYAQPLILVGLTVLFVATYVLWYRSMVKFAVPRWLIRR